MSDTMSLNWFGNLTMQNLEEVCNLLLKLLDGKHYTFVACNEGMNYRPSVRTHQRLTHEKATGGHAIKHWHDKEGRFAGFNVVDSYGVWGCSTSLSDNEVNVGYKHPYFSFEWNKVMITHRAPAGHLIYWVVALEE